jgi:hypothetical protein
MIAFSGLLLSSCMRKQPTDPAMYDQHINYIESGNEAYAPYLNKNSMQNLRFSKSYDMLGEYEPSGEAEKQRVMQKWKSSNTDVIWHEYYGHFIRVEMLRNNRDLKEMRLRFFQGQDIDPEIEGSISDAIEHTANKIIKLQCGKNSKDAIIVYKKPSVDILRPTPFYDYTVVAKAPSVMEYAFRCVY